MRELNPRHLVQKSDSLTRGQWGCQEVAATQSRLHAVSMPYYLNSCVYSRPPLPIVDLTRCYRYQFYIIRYLYFDPISKITVF